MNTRNFEKPPRLVTGVAKWNPYCEYGMIVLCEKQKTYYGMEQKRIRSMKR